MKDYQEVLVSQARGVSFITVGILFKSRYLGWFWGLLVIQISSHLRIIQVHNRGSQVQVGTRTRQIAAPESSQQAVCGILSSWQGYPLPALSSTIETEMTAALVHENPETGARWFLFLQSDRGESKGDRQEKWYGQPVWSIIRQAWALSCPTTPRLQLSRRTVSGSLATGPTVRQ